MLKNLLQSENKVEYCGVSLNYGRMKIGNLLAG